MHQHPQTLAGRPSSHFCVQPDSHYFCRTSQPLIFFSVLSALSVPYIVMHSYRYILFLYQYMYRYVTASNDSDNETTRFHETRCFSLIQTSRVCLVDSNYAGLLAAPAGCACPATTTTIPTCWFSHATCWFSHDAWLPSSAWQVVLPSPQVSTPSPTTVHLCTPSGTHREETQEPPL